MASKFGKYIWKAKLETDGACKFGKHSWRQVWEAHLAINLRTQMWRPNWESISGAYTWKTNWQRGKTIRGPYLKRSCGVHTWTPGFESANTEKQTWAIATFTLGFGTIMLIAKLHSIFAKQLWNAGLDSNFEHLIREGKLESSLRKHSQAYLESDGFGKLGEPARLGLGGTFPAEPPTRQTSRTASSKWCDGTRGWLDPIARPVKN